LVLGLVLWFEWVEDGGRSGGGRSRWGEVYRRSRGRRKKVCGEERRRDGRDDPAVSRVVQAQY